ncbi:centromere protein T [Gadus macrocephalus]|uniref:centromere protein T n=1 Tax=Gadus macrocephalus TaxID=80720 RepID=UPI0028CB5E75|nr:centromere protein T [Gadus macrocephalus]
MGGLLCPLHVELSMKTPAFVRMKKVFDPPLGEGSTAPQQGPPDTRKAPAKPRKVRAKQAQASHLPKSYLMSTFKHFAKTRVAADVFPALDNIVDAYFQRMALDLETYAHHAKRKTIEVADVELLLRRQGYVTDKVPVEVLIEKYLPMEYRRMLIPIATSGNIVIPKKK